MKLLLILSLCMILFQGTIIAQDLEDSVVKVSFVALRELLLERVFAKEENLEIKERYTEFQEKQKIEVQQMREKMEGGGFNLLEFATALPGTMKDYEEYHSYAKEELISVINKLYPGRFKLILDGAMFDRIIYSSVKIPDITREVRRYLLENRPSTKSN